MAWKKSITGMTLCIQLLKEDNVFAPDTRPSPEAGENIRARAELAVHKVFCRLGVPEQRTVYRDDALQEAAPAMTTDESVRITRRSFKDEKCQQCVQV